MSGSGDKKNQPKKVTGPRRQPNTSQRPRINPRQPPNRAPSVKEKTAREKSGRERSAKEKTGRERSAKEKTGRERSAKEKTGRERSAKEKTGRERSAKEKTGRERSTKDKTGTEKSGREKSGRERTAREKSGREKSAREKKKQALAIRKAEQMLRRSKYERKFSKRLEGWMTAGRSNLLPIWAQRQLAIQVARDKEQRKYMEKRPEWRDIKKLETVYPVETKKCDKEKQKTSKVTAKTAEYDWLGDTSKKKQEITTDKSQENQKSKESTVLKLEEIENIWRLVTDEKKEEKIYNSSDEVSEEPKWDPMAPLDVLRNRKQFLPRKMTENTVRSTALVLLSPDDPIQTNRLNGEKGHVPKVSFNEQVVIVEYKRKHTPKLNIPSTRYN